MTCGRCEWYKDREWDDKRGHCFLNPPTVVTESVSMDDPSILGGVSRLPLVLESDRCQHFSVRLPRG